MYTLQIKRESYSEENIFRIYNIILQFYLKDQRKRMTYVTHSLVGSVKDTILNLFTFFFLFENTLLIPQRQVYQSLPALVRVISAIIRLFFRL